MTSDQTERDIKAEIRRLLEEALVICGASLELSAIEASWGDTLNDEEALETLIHFLKTGSIFDQVTEEAEEFEELRGQHHERLTKH